jgi:transketolase
LVGGSADLTGSNGTQLSEGGNVEPGDFAGRYIHFGVREHGMAAICNGMALHGGFVPFGATFLVFTDYCRPSIRLSALMKQRVIYIMTHDSIFLGEDGPTHQPVEHLEALRAIPGVNVLRPTPAETAAAWVAALQYQGPTVLVLTRQGLPVRNTASIDEGVLKGAYILTEGQRGPDDLDLVILATGSETHLAQDAQAELEKDGKSVRVVSMVSEYLFEQQSDDYKASVLPVGVKRFAVEAGVTRGWHKWVGLDGGVHGIDRFGASAPASDLALRFGFTPEILVMKMQEVIGS